MNLYGDSIVLTQFYTDLRTNCAKSEGMMPVRCKGHYPDWVSHLEQRMEGLRRYEVARRAIVDALFAKFVGDKSGIYFFGSSIPTPFPFYYIGITSKGKNYAIKKRIDEHLLEKDYVHFAMAFPEKKHNYRSETLQFYCDHLGYSRPAHERLFDALDRTGGISSITWVSCDDLLPKDWDSIESHFVTTFNPPANGSKQRKDLSSPLLAPYADRFGEIKSYLLGLLK